MKTAIVQKNHQRNRYSDFLATHCQKRCEYGGDGPAARMRRRAATDCSIQRQEIEQTHHGLETLNKVGNPLGLQTGGESRSMRWPTPAGWPPRQNVRQGWAAEAFGERFQRAQTGQEVDHQIREVIATGVQAAHCVVDCDERITSRRPCRPPQLGPCTMKTSQSGQRWRIDLLVTMSSGRRRPASREGCWSRQRWSPARGVRPRRRSPQG